MRRKAPDFAIAPVLEALGAVDVPRVRGDGHQKMRCFLHEDNTPSASVGEFSYRCFQCGVTGDAIKLLREQEGLDFASAKRRAEELTEGVGGGVSRQVGRTGWGAGQGLLE